MKTRSNVMLMDIETSPCVGYFWRPGFKLNIPAENIVEESKIICISYKWHNDPFVYRLTWDKKQCDKEMLSEFIDTASEADCIVGHNSDRFDIKWVKTRAVVHGLQPLNKLQSIDTLKLARSNFNFNSNRLDYLGRLLVGDHKKDTGGFGLWKAVMAGDKKALQEMGDYCDQDVLLLEKVYDKLLPHTAALPVHIGGIMGLGKCSCEACGSVKLIRHRRYTNVSSGPMVVLRCKDCGKNKAMPEKTYSKIKGE
jgi:hypothetical protein